MGETKSNVSAAAIESKIYTIRGQKMILDHDLAGLYGVSTKALKQAVKRNLERFPSDFMFLLTYHEFANLRSQFVTSSWGGLRIGEKSPTYRTAGRRKQLSPPRACREAGALARSLLTIGQEDSTLCASVS